MVDVDFPYVQLSRAPTQLVSTSLLSQLLTLIWQMKLLDKGGKYECCRHWSSERQKNFHSPSPVSNLGSLNPKCPRNPVAMAAAQ